MVCSYIYLLSLILFQTPAYVIQVESSVRYPAGDFLAEYLYDLTSSPDYVRPIILDFSHVSRLDITAIEVKKLQGLIELVLKMCDIFVTSVYYYKYVDGKWSK